MVVATRSRIPIMRASTNVATGAHVVNAYVILIGITTSFSIRLVGDLPVGEIFLIGALPLLLFFRGKVALKMDLKVVFALIALWFVGQFVADSYNHIEIVNRMRGDALIIFFGSDLLGLWLLVAGSDKRKLMFVIGLMIGALASVKLQPSPAVEDYPWKFGYAWGTILLGLLLSSYFYSRRRFFLAALPVLVLCGVNLILNYRSAMLQLMMAFILLFPIVPERLAGLQLLPRAGSAGRVLVLVTFALIAGEAADALVHFVTNAGYISEEDQAKNQSQATGGNLLLGGRPEFVVGLRAALDAPIIGHGSWPEDRKYIEMLADMLAETNGSSGFAALIANGEGGLIPSHSHIVGSWVSAGIFGLIFWAYIIWVVLRSIVTIANMRPPLAPVYMFMLITMFWDIWFSPFALFRRLTEAFLLVVMSDLLKGKTVSRAKRWVRLHSRSNNLAQRQRPRIRPSFAVPGSPSQR